MIKPQGTFSADVQLFLHVAEETYELGQIGPEFALLRKPQSIQATEAELETIIDGQSSRYPIRVVDPATTSSRKFTFKAMET
ncbi:MAG: hypothetical protein F9B45_04835 [Phycisphaera sp. RhM]|nr:hypothetical protein [Phycisphaera sp. RhM]